MYEKLYMYLLLALSHGQELEAVPSVPHTVRQFTQVPGRIRTGTQDKHDGGLGCGLVVYVVKADDGWSDVRLAHPHGDKVGDGSVDPVHSEAAEEEELLEVTQPL